MGTLPPDKPVVTLMIGTHVLVSNCISASSVHDHLEFLTQMPDHKKFKPEVLSVQITYAAFEITSLWQYRHSNVNFFFPSISHL